MVLHHCMRATANDTKVQKNVLKPARSLSSQDQNDQLHIYSTQVVEYILPADVFGFVIICSVNFREDRMSLRPPGRVLYFLFFV